MFVIWRACERFGITPPGVKLRWEDNSPSMQAKLIAFEQTASHTEYERMQSLIPRFGP